MGIIEGTSDVKSLTCEYDFAKDAHTGTVTLRSADPAMPNEIPTGSVVFGGSLEVLTQVTGGAGSTLAVQLEGANDLVNAAAVGGAPWSTTGFKSLIPTSGATSVKTTAARNLKCVVAVNDLTAGKFRVTVLYK